VLKLTQGEGADVVIVAGDGKTIARQAIDVAKRRGRVVLVALLTEYAPQLPAYDILSKELCIIGSTMSNHEDTRRAIELVASGQVDVEAIATHVLPIEDAQRGIELARTKADGAIKVVFTFDAA
jgi:threonine dehydrogenase-like Zn-dependent dehydrogenase